MNIIEQKRRAEEKLEQLLLEGLNSGPPTPMTKQDWEKIRNKLKNRATARTSKKTVAEHVKA